MNKNVLIAILVLTVLILGGYVILDRSREPVPVPVPESAVQFPGETDEQVPAVTAAAQYPVSVPASVPSAVSAPSSAPAPVPSSNTKTYSNAKLGFSFRYPNTWSQDGAETEVWLPSGNGASGTDIHFMDAVSGASLLIQYRPAPSGAQIYGYNYSQYVSSQGWYATGGTSSTVGGKTAVRASMLAAVDGRGNALNPQIQTEIVDLLDSRQGSIELQFKTPAPGKAAEIAKFDRLLASFAFTK